MGLILVECLVLGCENRKTDSASEKPSDTPTGFTLAKTYCSSCHLFPEPELLDRRTWTEKVLPAMGHRFGIYEDVNRDSLLENGIGKRIVNEAGIFPTTPILSDSDWKMIKQYYQINAPDTLLSEFNGNLSLTTLFIPEFTNYEIKNPAVSAMMFDPGSKEFYLSDCSKESSSSLVVFNSGFRFEVELGFPHPVSKLSIINDTLYVLMMGHFIPSDEPAGRLLKVIKGNDGYEGYSLALKNLKRPVDLVHADLDNDGDEDLVICEFGNHTGNLSLFLREGKNYKKKILNPKPGAIKALIQDIDSDGRKDVIALMAQGDESVFIYYNKGQGEFDAKQVLRFPAVYGSTSINLADFNNDGLMDILYTNGDNADFSPILKPYHGVRIFTNSGNNEFIESYFFMQHGTYHATARDFDHDGDLDIASISFFPDFSNTPEEGFVYLENQFNKTGKLEFVTSTVKETIRGRWLTMEVADIDRDGDDDIVLGSFTAMGIANDRSGKSLKNNFHDSPTFMVLRNNTK